MNSLHRFRCFRSTWRFAFFEILSTLLSMSSLFQDWLSCQEKNKRKRHYFPFVVKSVLNLWFLLMKGFDWLWSNPGSITVVQVPGSTRFVVGTGGTAPPDIWLQWLWQPPGWCSGQASRSPEDPPRSSHPGCWSAPVHSSIHPDRWGYITKKLLLKDKFNFHIELLSS